MITHSQQNFIHIEKNEVHEYGEQREVSTVTKQTATVLSNRVPYKNFKGTSMAPIISASKQRPIVILFTAEWLGGAHILEKFFQALSPEFPEVIIYRVDVDANKELPKQFGVSRVPTTFFLFKGEIMGHIAGMAGKRKLKEKLAQICRK